MSDVRRRLVEQAEADDSDFDTDAIAHEFIKPFESISKRNNYTKRHRFPSWMCRIFLPKKYRFINDGNCSLKVMMQVTVKLSSHGVRIKYEPRRQAMLEVSFYSSF